MADFADIGSDYTERWIEGVLDEHRHQQSIAETFEAGRCRNCAEKLDDGRAFCDADCAKDFSDRQRMSKRNGR